MAHRLPAPSLTRDAWGGLGELEGVWIPRHCFLLAPCLAYAGLTWLGTNGNQAQCVPDHYVAGGLFAILNFHTISSKPSSAAPALHEYSTLGP